MRKFEVEFAVGYDHGGWELDTVKVEVHESELHGDFEGYLYDIAEAELDDQREYNADVSFYHPMYYTEITQEDK